ncbi:hypothetical protein E4T56_gene16323 [Termitomyces sp. T112]|nr:hypothetical protein E4T56_gene16323 [Termitomyces sp. T112]
MFLLRIVNQCFHPRTSPFINTQCCNFPPRMNSSLSHQRKERLWPAITAAIAKSSVLRTPMIHVASAVSSETLIV